jgi:hypothetical protein
VVNMLGIVEYTALMQKHARYDSRNSMPACVVCGASCMQPCCLPAV